MIAQDKISSLQTQYAPTVWLNGQYVNIKEADVHIMTHGLHYGSSVYEGIRVYNHKPFKLRQHIERMLHSATSLHLDSPYNIEELEEIILEIVLRNNLTFGYIRPLAWRGAESPRIDGINCSCHWAVVAWASFLEQRHSQRIQGIRLEINPTWRKAPAGCLPYTSKSAGMYTVSTIAKIESQKRGFDDSILLDMKSNVTEATTSNIFFIQDKRLYTPIPDCFLNGITRQTVLQIAENLGLEAQEYTIPVSNLNTYEAAFLTGTSIEIMPISSITYGTQVYNYNSQHPLILQLCKAYDQITY